MFQKELSELEDMCTLVGEGMQDHIDEQQEKIEEVMNPEGGF